jgi:glutamate dehydrogenase
MLTSTISANSKAQIRSSLSRWDGDLGGEANRELFTAFVEEALERMRGPFLSKHPPMQVLDLFAETFQFALHRAADDIKARIDQRTSKKGMSVLVNMADQPFIMDTVLLFLNTRDAASWGGFSLVFKATRDPSGRLVGVGGSGSEESLILLQTDQGRLGDLEQATRTVRVHLEHARAMVSDFKTMNRAIERFVEKCELMADRRPDVAIQARETGQFLKWLSAENFVFMGISSDTNLGFQRLDGPFAGRPDGSWPVPHFPGTVQVRKSSTESPVHRAGRIDEILVMLPGETDERLFIRGMFTYRAVTQPSRHVPILRNVLADILKDQTTTGPGSYRYKGMANVFDSLPTEFLFTAPRNAVGEMVERVFEAEQQHEVGVTFSMITPDSAFCVVIMPKDDFDEELRKVVQQDILAVTRATYSDYGVLVGRFDAVLLHFYLTGVVDPGTEAIRALTERTRERVTPWSARLWSALADAVGETEADRLSQIYSSAFPSDWDRLNTVTRSVRDIQLMEQLERDPVRADIFAHGDDLYVRVYQKNDVVLSDLLPVLSQFGLKVIDSTSAQIAARAANGGTQVVHLDTFRVEGVPGVERSTFVARGPLLTDALSQVFAGRVSDDRLNTLVVCAGLAWSEVDVLRAYMRYSRQIGMKQAILRMNEIMLANPIMCASLVKLFHARFDPDLPGDRAEQVRLASRTVVDEMRYIQTHDEDQLFSTLQNLVESTLRTNYYRHALEPWAHSWYLSFKLDPAQIRMMPANKPMFEIYVHSRDVEGVHLRFGKVARGGLRWSDRDDYRTEVLGLVTTQRVKNVVIVPTGSKGGFFLRNASRDPAERRRQADELYKTYIRALLDVTDNNVGDRIVPPVRVVRYDEDDPYLVVAADKGTAHLSDTANAISQEYGFWLGDAFASGGSNGYDHKKVGITARGGWVLVRRHFAEMGIDVDNQDITVVGVGDMGGDVFGNGLIETRHLRLKAAFNHVHIFLDPQPDAARTYEERVRLFRTMGGWDKYDINLISTGGGVFDRRVKSVPLSPQARDMLGIDKAEAEPEEIIRAILLMDVDLLWNGGIGTYIKASTETHADADDRSNDAVRIDANQLRAKVVGEGGNLGLTQRARIEAALRGFRLNNDAMDNSAGVDLSDHEVNLKILLNRAVSRREMSTDQRNVLLEQMTDEVAKLVLEDNDAHGRQLSRDVIRSRTNIFPFARAIAFIEREFARDRSTLQLPTEPELERRASAGLGLTRPELAVLSSWVKMYVKRELLKSDPKQIPGYDVLLRGYFPQQVQERFGNDITNHMLADEIATTVTITRMFADGGAAFFPMAIEATGAGVAEITHAYRKAARIARFHMVRDVLEDLRSKVPLDALYRAWIDVDDGARDVALYWLSSSGTVPADDVIDEMRETAERVYALQASAVVKANAEKLSSIRAQGIPEEVASLILKAQYLNIALSVWSEARRTSAPIEGVAVRYLAVGRASLLQGLLDDLASRPATGSWDPLAMRILYTRFQTHLRTAVGKCVIDGAPATVDALEPVLGAGRLAEVRAHVDGLLAREPLPSVAALLVLEERVSSALARL